MARNPCRSLLLQWPRFVTNRTSLPFLYQTHSIQQRSFHPSHPRPRLVVPSQQTSAEESEEKLYPDEDEYLPDDESNADPVTFGDSEADRARASTLTDIERTAFARLFRGLVDKNSSPEPTSQPAKTDNEPENESPNRIPNEEGDFSDTDPLYTERFSDLDSLIAEVSPKSDNRALDQYPEPLRGMARKAQTKVHDLTRATQRGRDIATAHASLPPTVRAELDETQRIEDLLYGARTDLAIFTILETEVFARSRSLGQSIAANQSPTPTATLAPIPTTAFSALTLLALRLLVRRGAHSTLPALLLRTLHGHGFYTTTLCTSTALYNELLSYSLRTRNSGDALAALLQELHDAGLAPDAKTHNVLDRATLWRYRALRGEFGAALRTVEGFVERQTEGAEVVSWKWRVKTGLEEAALQRSRRAVEEERMRGEGAWEEDGDEKIALNA